MPTQNGNWVPIGPYADRSLPGNDVPGAGRIDGIDISRDYDGAGHPAMYLAMPGGGVWRSSDFLSAAPTWMPLTDHLPGIPDARRVELNNVSTLAVDPKHPQTIYARAGGAPPAILKSADGGVSWVLVGEDQFSGVGAIARVLVDPLGTAYAAFNAGGFWQSTDGGAHWANVASTELDGVEFHDAVYFIDQNDQINIYVGVIDRQGRNRSGLWSFISGIWNHMPTTMTNMRGETFNPSVINHIRMSADPAAGVCASLSQGDTGIEACYVYAQQSAGTQPLHRLFNPVSGDHFYTMSDGERTSAITRHGYQSEGEACYAFSGQSVGTVPFHRLFNPTIHKRLYTTSDAEVANATARDGYQSEGVGLLNVFKLIQGVWQPQWFSITDWFITQGGYVQGVCIAPDGRLYAGGIGLAQSAGSQSFIGIGTDSQGHSVHVDEHVIVAYRGQIYVGTDGGLTRFTPQPGQSGVVSWESLNTPSLTNFLSTGASAHPTDPNIFLAGNQDTGIARRGSNGQWSYSGFSNEREKLRFDPEPANQGRFAFSGDPNNGFYLSQDGGVSFQGFGPPGVPAPDPPPPFSFHQNNSARIMIGWTTVYETPDRGITWNQKLKLQTPPSALTYVGDHSAYIGAGGQLYETHDDGQSWPVVNFNFGPSIVSLCADSANPDAIYVATPSRVLRRLNPQAAWEDLSGNLALAITVMALLPSRTGTDPYLFLGTGAGVFYTPILNGGKTSWTRFGTGLPDAGADGNTVTDLEITVPRRFLLAATWGRGAWGANIVTHITTDVTPGAASVGQSVFVFGKESDGRIWVNQAVYGQAFSGWFEVQGNGLTDAAPAATSLNSVNVVFVFIKGLNQRIYLNQAVSRQAFSGWFEVQGNGLTDTAPAATSLNSVKVIFAFIKGLDRHIYLNQAEYGHAFSGWFEVQGNGLTDAAPAATSLDSVKVIFAFIKGLDQRIYLNQAVYGQAFSGWFEVQGNGLTDAAPAATSLDSVKVIFVFIKGLDRRIYVNQAEYGHAFSGWFEVQGNGMTDVAPVATSIGNVIFVFIKGLNGRIYVNQAEYGHAFSGWFPVENE